MNAPFERRTSNVSYDDFRLPGSLESRIARRGCVDLSERGHENLKIERLLR